MALPHYITNGHIQGGVIVPTDIQKYYRVGYEPFLTHATQNVYHSLI